MCLLLSVLMCMLGGGELGRSNMWVVLSGQWSTVAALGMIPNKKDGLG